MFKEDASRKTWYNEGVNAYAEKTKNDTVNPIEPYKSFSVRMDVFAIDEQDTVYNTEMQAKERDDLQKRSRYYQSLMDTSLLEPGAADYNQLNDSYIIMILTFDLFGDGNYKYTFLPQCQESPNTILQDGREMGREEQRIISTITLVKKNMARGLSLKDIADFLDEDVSEVQKIADLIQQHPEADADSLYEILVPEADRSFEW